MSAGPLWCNTCDNQGEIECLCGGDFCACGEETQTCPACDGISAEQDIPDEGGEA